MLKNLFKKTPEKNEIYRGDAAAGDWQNREGAKPEIPAGMWKKCNKCQAPVYTDDVIENHYICPKCGGYFRIHAMRRIRMIEDPESFEDWGETWIENGESVNPLHFPGYEAKKRAVQEKTGLSEAITIGKVRIEGMEAVLGVCDARFFMSSMGHEMGERITRAVERATKEKLPVILFCCSGGARMQEGMISLMQMAKTAGALKRHSEAGLLYIPVLTDPTTGGVTASFAMLGDIILAEPGALIGFAGPRVIEQTIGQKLPEGFQRSEFLLEHGFVDAIVEREKLRETLARILRLHKAGEQKADRREGVSHERIKDGQTQPAKLNEISPWERVKISRMQGRPTGISYIEKLFSDFIEFHGDRYFGDDPAVVGGIAWFEGRPVTVIAQQKGLSTKDNIRRNFGMPSPEGYRKALRLMKQAEKFGRPVICFVDTPGAFCGMEAEERGQGEAIARNLFELSALKVPVLSIVIGEGGSGGALAMAVADEVWMLENAVYSILSPEGFASILWKNSKKAAEAAKVMKITAADLKELGVIERIIREPEPAGKDNLDEICGEIKTELERFMNTYTEKSGEELTQNRYERFRKF